MRQWTTRCGSLGLILLIVALFASPAGAEPSGGIAEWSDSTQVPAPPPPGAITPENLELARSSQSLATWATGGLTLTGAALIVSGSDNGGNDSMQGLGVAMLGTGMLFGPSLGWARAGYWDRAIGGATLRCAIVGVGFSAGLMAGVSQSDGWEGLGIVLLGMTAGVCGATIEGLVECNRMGPYLRTHGRPGDARFSLLTPHGPGLAVTIPLH